MKWRLLRKEHKLPVLVRTVSKVVITVCWDSRFYGEKLYTHVVLVLDWKSFKYIQIFYIVFNYIVFKNCGFFLRFCCLCVFF